MMDVKKRNLILLILRRGTYKWGPKGEALRASKVGRNQYRCALCGPSKVYRNKEKQQDHIIPVQRVDGIYDGLEEVADRMFAPKEGWQTLCLPHHKEKSARENTLRAEARKAMKLAAKSKASRKRK